MSTATAATLILSGLFAADPEQTLVPGLVHLRIEGPREWSSFPERPQAARLEVSFPAAANAAEFTLRLRQQDVKQSWRVSVNGMPLGELMRDENDMVIALAAPPGALRDGDNLLVIQQQGKDVDDVMVGEITLIPRPVREVLHAGAVAIGVTDADTGDNIPCRLTVVDGAGSLVAVGAQSNDHLAVRPGTIYTATGRAEFGLPAGRYTVYAGRGFEYSLASAEIIVETGAATEKSLAIRREVPTPGYVACDTHVHTLTHSGHGDATVQERMITLAGEGIELPIAADHNVQVDHEPFARRMGVRKFLTPVIGNEVTTKLGHFNVFPVERDARPPNQALGTWSEILDDVFRTPGVKVAILNHARDLHSGVRPFGPKLFNAAVGENTAGWAMRFNAMEVVNSSATQHDVLRLFHDWMAVMNGGRLITPVGASDSHDVLRHFVGQGRTYIRCDDRDPGAIDVGQAVTNFVQGEVLVSYGLLTELTVGGKYRSGELATVPDDELRVVIRVLGPHWTSVDRVQLYANGELIREEAANAAGRELPPGVKWEADWTLARPKHDVHLVAIALGPGVSGPWWKTAKPYQSLSPDWEPHVVGASGAVRVDGDQDGQWTSPRRYAERLVAAAGGSFGRLVESLADYDPAVAAQAAWLWHGAGQSLMADDTRAALDTAAPAVREGFTAYLEAWREGEIARSGTE